jgi:hypothetical protein
MTPEGELLETLRWSQSQSVMVGLMIYDNSSPKFLITKVSQIIPKEKKGYDFDVFLYSHDIHGNEISDRLIPLSSIEAVRIYRGLQGQRGFKS